jgi:hypothetical protein
MFFASVIGELHCARRSRLFSVHSRSFFSSRVERARWLAFRRARAAVTLAADLAGTPRSFHLSTVRAVFWRRFAVFFVPSALSRARSASSFALRLVFFERLGRFGFGLRAAFGFGRGADFGFGLGRAGFGFGFGWGAGFFGFGFGFGVGRLF